MSTLQKTQERKPRHHVPTSASLTWVWLTLALGLIFTGLGFRFAVSIDEREIDEYLSTAATSIANASSQTALVLPVLEPLIKTFTEIQAEINKGVPMTQAVLASHLWSPPPPGLETTALQLLPLTPAGESADRQNIRNLLGNAEESSYPVLQFDGKKIAPALPASTDFFPILLQAGPKESMDMAGLDRSNQPEHALAMTMARDSGMLSSRSTFPIDKQGLLETIYYFPLYKGGVVPVTREERRERLLGFVSATTRYPASAVLDFLPQAFHGVSLVFTAALPADPSELEPKLQDFLKQPLVRVVNFNALDMPYSTITTATPALRSTLSTPTRWWILGLGIMITLSLEALLLWVRHQSNQIVALVKERTRDLAERTEALTASNSALKESEQRYRMLADNISDVIYTGDLNGNCTYISPSIQNQCGYTPEECIGLPLSSYLDEESAAKAREVMAERFRIRVKPLEGEAPARTNEYVILCKDGMRKNIETTTTTLWDEAGKIVGILGVMRDITGRKQSEQERGVLQKAYLQAQKMEAIGTLAGGVAHDFNNLLTGVLGHADMLKHEYAHNSEAYRSIELIETAATRARELTSQLLGFARKGKFMQVPVEINKVLSDLTGLLERTVDKNIQITRISTAGNPAVLGDPGQINQIFLNLAINARDAMPRGGVLTFKTEIRHISEKSQERNFELAPGNFCVVTVSDTGIGIPRQNLEHIFEPFFTDKEEGKGTGLGLAMVYGVVKNHKGGIKVDSTPGSGSTFTIYLPLHEDLAAPLPKTNINTLIKGTGTVLLIDDQAIVRQVGEKMLKQLGYNVELCENGVIGLAYYREHWQTVDVVLIDMIMPEMGGLECLEQMRLINPDIKAILCTGFSREDIAGKINECHVLGFIQKPYRLQELSEVIAGAKRHNQLVLDQ